MLSNISKLDIDNLPSILLLFGEEDFLRDEALNYVEKNIVPKISTEYDCDTLSKDNATLDKLLDIARSYPFLSTKRTIIVKDFDSFFSEKMSKKSIEQSPLFKYLQSPQPSTFLVLTAKLESIKGISKNPENTKLAKFPFDIILRNFEWMEFPKVWESSFPSWIRSRLKIKGKTIADNALQILISHTNPTLRDLNNEIDKILLYILERPTITEEDAIECIGTSRQFNVFELQKAVGMMDLPKSLYILQNMLAVERAEMLILAILTKYFITTWRLAELGKVTEGNKYEISKKLGVSAFFLKDYVNSLTKYGINRIDNSFKYLCEADEALKSGSTSGLTILQNLLIKLMN